MCEGADGVVADGGGGEAWDGGEAGATDRTFSTAFSTCHDGGSRDSTPALDIVARETRRPDAAQQCSARGQLDGGGGGVDGARGGVGASACRYIQYCTWGDGGAGAYRQP